MDEDHTAVTWARKWYIARDFNSIFIINFTVLQDKEYVRIVTRKRLKWLLSENRKFEPI